jgi:hypothetical protein
MYDDEVEDRDADPVLGALRSWAVGHPSRDQAFMAIMGGDDGENHPVLITPREFLDHVERKTDLESVRRL